MKNFIYAAAAGLLIAGTASAAELAGVQVADTATVGEQELVLNGLGLRTATWFNVEVYVGALYLPEKSSSPDEILAMEGPKRIQLYMVRDVDRESLTDAWKEGFKENSPKQEYDAIEDQIPEFNALFSNVKDGDVMTLDYVPGEGTTLLLNDKPKGTIPGADFNTAMLRIWLGPNPPNDDLKDGMLGK